MVNQWFYSHEGSRHGPFSTEQMKSLAITGNILPTDTVWKNEMPTGVLAKRVNHLFPSEAARLAVLNDAVLESVVVAAATAPAPAPTEEAFESIPDNIDLAPEIQAPVKVDRAPPQPIQRRRVNALSGVVIISQDGTYVKFRKKCITCGHEDSSWNTLQITPGVMKASFYCRKCRKSRQVAMQGIQG